MSKSKTVYIIMTGEPYGDSWPLRVYNYREDAEEALERLKQEADKYGTTESTNWPEWSEGWRKGRHFEIQEREEVIQKG